MHVRAESRLTADQTRALLAELGRRDFASAESGRGQLFLDSGREPPKLFLRGPALGIPPAAEVDLQKNEAGSAVVLRLMWGPFPAPLPRAVAAAGVLLAAAVLLLAGRSAGAIVAALALAGVPLAALLLQRSGER